MAGRPKRRARLLEEARAAGLPEPKKFDYREQLQEKLVTAIEAGTAPWQKTWSPGSGVLPYNPFSADAITNQSTRGYRGINRLVLMWSGYDDNRWCTAKQAADRGIVLREGEAKRGVVCEVWKSFAPKPGERDADASKPEREPDRGIVTVPQRMGVRYFTVYNAQQFENFPEPERVRSLQTWEAVERAERVVKDAGVRVVHGDQHEPCYVPGLDEIRMPTPARFESASTYYDTLMHETVHSTGHPDRLKRDQTGRFGTASYAREELVAEIGSLFLSAEVELPHNVERHASYVANWIQVIREDKNAIPRAASAASLAVDRIMERERERALVLEEEIVRVVVRAEEREPQPAAVVVAERVRATVPDTTRGDEDRARNRTRALILNLTVEQDQERGHER